MDGLSNIPIPDPSTVTRIVIDDRITALRELIQERLDGMDKAIDLTAQAANRIPTAAQIDIQNLRELTNEKFHSLNNRFNEQQKREDQTELETKANVKVAFDAADRAISKTDASMAKTEAFLTKQIDHLFLLSQTNANRLQVLESKNEGAKEMKTDSRGSVGIIIAAVGVATAVLVATMAWNHSTPSVAPVGPQTVQIQPTK